MKLLNLSMKNFKGIDLTGQTFGRLTVIERVITPRNANLWRCRCICGEITVKHGKDLLRGFVKSCGCRQGVITHGLSRHKGGKHTNLYKVWIQMHQRCNNPNNKAFKHYGGRGINVCLEWKDYKSFHDWAMANGYKAGLSIERINNNDGYSLANCKWIPMELQPKNTRITRHITFQDKTKTLREWGNITGINARTIGSRIDKGWSIEKALTTPPERKNREITTA